MLVDDDVIIILFREGRLMPSEKKLDISMKASC